MLYKISMAVISTLLVVFAIFSTSLAVDKRLKFPLPHFSPLVTADQCRCEAIVGAFLHANTTEDKGVLGEVFKGTDKISLQIEGDILYFLSGASFKLGEAKPVLFKIIHNSEEQVLAILPEQTTFGYTVDIFTLNKKTGVAVWTKTRSYDSFSGGAPSAQSFYLKCK